MDPSPNSGERVAALGRAVPGGIWGWGLPVSVPFPISLLSAPAPPAFLPLHFWESGNLLLPKAPAGIVPEHLQALTEVFALCPN